MLYFSIHRLCFVQIGNQMEYIFRYLQLGNGGYIYILLQVFTVGAYEFETLLLYLSAIFFFSFCHIFKLIILI